MKKENLIKAIKEDFEDIYNLYHSIDSKSDKKEILNKLEIHIKFKKRRFKNYEK